jgi:phage FluMu protein Com
MPLTVHCSHCRRLLAVRDEDVGKFVRCPSCRQAFAAHIKAETTLPPSPVPDFELSRKDPPLRPKEQPQASDARNPAIPRIVASAESEGGTYAVQLDAEALASPGRRRDHEQRGRRRRARDSFEDEPASDVRPHRGVLILFLGILSLVLACIPLAGWILGGIAMSMAANDEKLMDARAMDRSGWVMTRSGQICGIFGVFAATISFIFNMVMAVHTLKHG